MSVKMALLSLLVDGPRYGYQLRADFEERTGGAWPLNVGQVYTTLARLARDGLVDVEGTADGDDTRTYAATHAGREAVAGWFATPVARGDTPPREELAIKVAVALAAPDVDVRDVIQRQRTETVRALQKLTRQKASLADDDLTNALLVESQIFAVEAEARWLDLAESMVTHRQRAPGPTTPPGRPRAATHAEPATGPLDTAADTPAADITATDTTPSDTKRRSPLRLRSRA